MSPRSGETWLFDLGNSRAKLARVAHGAPTSIAALDWVRPDFAVAARGVMDAWPRPDRILVASVASLACAGQVRELLPRGASIEVEWLRSPQQACGVRNRYAKPERLGVDRFLAMVAVHAQGSGAGIVIGCGTALTLDAVGAEGEHAAGLISLSPARMLQALQGETAIADSNPDAFRADADDDTAAALQAGCRAAAGALVEWFVARQHAPSREAAVWLHGGWAERLAEWLARDGFHAQVFEHAVLHGMAVWARNSCDDS